MWKIKGGRRINLFSSCNLGCLVQKLVPETTTKVITIQREYKATDSAWQLFFPS